MDIVRVELPSALLRAAKLEGRDLSEEAARLLALELYREDKVSLERAAELCATPLAAFMDFAAKHGVAPLRSNSEELEEERRGRLLSESIALAEAHGSTATLDREFGRDLEEIINSHREPLNPPEWD